jgi:hypothetical protein
MLRKLRALRWGGEGDSGVILRLAAVGRCVTERVLRRKASARFAYSSLADPCYVQHGVDRLASRHAGLALPASTSSSLVQHGRATMPKPPRPTICLLRQRAP